MANSLTIAFPCFNAEPFLEQTLASIVQQRGVDIELLVVDDGSTDRSVALLREFSEKHHPIRIITNHKNMGVAESVNTLIREVRTEFVLLVAADDVLYPNMAERLLSHLGQLGEAYVSVTCPYIYGDQLAQPRFSSSGQMLKFVGAEILQELSRDEVLTRLLRSNFIPGHAVHRSRDLKKVRLSGLPYDDWGMWCQLAALGRIGFVPEPLYIYRQHTASLTRRLEFTGEKELAQIQFRSRYLPTADVKRQESIRAGNSRDVWIASFTLARGHVRDILRSQPLATKLSVSSAFLALWFPDMIRLRVGRWLYRYIVTVIARFEIRR